MTESEWLVKISKSFSSILGNQISTECCRYFSLLFFTDGKSVVNILKEFEEGAFVEGFPQLVANGSRRIFRYDSDALTKDDEIMKIYTPVYWKEIIHLCNLETSEELNTGLRTRIGALKNEFQRLDISESIERKCTASEISFPIEGKFDAFSKKCIFNFLIENSIFDILIAEEFLESPRRINLQEISEELFIGEIKWRDYYILDIRGRIAWFVDWDDFYYSVLGTKDMIEKYSLLDNVEEIQLTKFST
jgi:hypothetical protein